MSRRPAAGHLSRDAVVLLVKQQLERAGAHGITKREMLDAIGPERTSLVTIQRALDDLRNLYDAQITCTGADRRWRLEAPLAIPLLDPGSDELVDMHLSKSVLDALGLGGGPIERIVEDFDEKARKTTSPSKLPSRKVVTSSVTLGSTVDRMRLGRLVLACRREALRIKYVSPWKAAGTPPRWYAIEPWALRLHDGAFYLRGWSRPQRGARTFRFVDIQAVEDLEDAAERVPRHAVPVDAWAEENEAFGMDADRPGVAVIRFRGDIARALVDIHWHPKEVNHWLVPGELLQRTVPFRSCREIARRIVMLGGGVDSIEPFELCEEVGRLAAPLVALWRSASRRRAQARKSRSKSK